MSIMLKETRAEDWPLWLAYDTEFWHYSITTALNPSQFQKRLFDDLLHPLHQHQNPHVNPIYHQLWPFLTLSILISSSTLPVYP